MNETTNKIMNEYTTNMNLLCLVFKEHETALEFKSIRKDMHG